MNNTMALRQASTTLRAQSFTLMRGVLLLMAALALAVPAAAAPLSAEVFGTLPLETDVVLTPDGHYLAWVDHAEPRPRVVMFDVEARKRQRILAVPERTKVRALVWSDNQTLLTVLSQTSEAISRNQVSREYFVTVAHDVGGGDGRMLPTSGVGKHAEAAVLARIINARPRKPGTVIMSSVAQCHNGANCLIEVETATGKATLIKAGNEHTQSWVVDHDGVPVAREDWDWTKRAYRVYALSGAGVKEILRKDDNEQPLLAGLLADDSALVLLASNGRSHRAAWALPLDGSPAKLLAEDPDADVAGVYTDPYTGAIIGVYISGSKTTVHWLDPAAQHRYDVLQRAFPNREINVYGWTADGAKTLVRVETPSTPPVYYLVDFASHHADIAAEEYPGLSGASLGELKQITYKARDGTEIPAYLTLPAGKVSSPPPLVVLPHGGPNARDYPRFDWLVQFLATRGYAVLQPQFRGSTGFGDAFERAGYRQWGGLMQDDVTDGVHAMIDQGIADAHHICIVGASYGGYAALAGAAFTPNLYACAASINGVSDLNALVHGSLPVDTARIHYTSAAESELRERIGSLSDSTLTTKSPINSVASITIPVLIIYGTGDAVVPNEQSARMAQALTAAGKNVTVVTLSGEDHWLSGSDTRVKVLHELEGFLKSQL
jgi:dipeptidyl aminopeptidase/acylaminoacyl peptidase